MATFAPPTVHSWALVSVLCTSPALVARSCPSGENARLVSALPVTWADQAGMTAGPVGCGAAEAKGPAAPETPQAVPAASRPGGAGDTSPNDPGLEARAEAVAEAKGDGEVGGAPQAAAIKHARNVRTTERRVQVNSRLHLCRSALIDGTH
jgi:hypothetical protein